LRFQAVVLAVVTVVFVLRVPVLAIAVSHVGRVEIVAGRVVVEREDGGLWEFTLRSGSKVWVESSLAELIK
jgi:hypothetical protein